MRKFALTGYIHSHNGGLCKLNSGFRNDAAEPVRAGLQQMDGVSESGHAWSQGIKNALRE